MPFTNPLVAGTTLVRSAINSPNYVPGVSGWAIFKDGSAEFNNVTVRGAVDIKGSDGSEVVITASLGGRINLYPNTQAGLTVNTPGQIYASAALWGGGPGHESWVNINSPDVTDSAGHSTPASLFLGGQLTDGTAYPGGFTPGGTLMEFNGDGYIHGVSKLNGNVAMGADASVAGNAAIAGNVSAVNATFTGKLTAANRVTGNVVIVPVANAYTSAVVTFPAPILGTSFTCQTTPMTTVPGAEVLGTSYSSISSTGVTIWIRRTNANSTTVSYTVEGF